MVANSGNFGNQFPESPIFSRFVVLGPSFMGLGYFALLAALPPAASTDRNNFPEFVKPDQGSAWNKQSRKRPGVSAWGENYGQIQTHTGQWHQGHAKKLDDLPDRIWAKPARKPPKCWTRKSWRRLKKGYTIRELAEVMSRGNVTIPAPVIRARLRSKKIPRKRSQSEAGKARKTAKNGLFTNYKTK